jgi:hypothetical protein
MLELTEAAKSQLHRSLSAGDKPKHQGKCFRIVPKDEKSLTLRLAKPAPSDTVFTHDGDTILAIPKALQPFFRDKNLDIDKSGKLTFIK